MRLRLPRKKPPRAECGSWLPTEGAGKDTHVCVLEPDHTAANHKCKCGAVWWVD